MINYVSGIVFVVAMLVEAVVVVPMMEGHPGTAVVIGLVWTLVNAGIAAAIRIAAQWERGVVFRLGKFSGVRGPGLYIVIPLIDQVRVVDTRVRAINIAKQQVITKDNVPISIDAVLFYKVEDAASVVTKVQDHQYAILLYARTSLRDVIGQYTLDQVLTAQESITRSIQTGVETISKDWGVDVTGIKLLELEVPDELRKMMSRQASAEREKRATIIKADGDREAAENLAAAAKTMAASPGAMQLRTLQTLDGLGPTASNTVVLAVPINVMDALNSFTTWMQERRGEPPKS
jgi:regulator of protease activity HflC (stomatin/prohibitin superfamily)